MKRLAAAFVTVATLGACTGLFFQPHSVQVLSPERFNLVYENVELTASDGVRLFAWYLPAAAPAAGSILFLHGNAENISTHIGSVYWLPARGFNVLLLDYRGFGASGGRPTIAGSLRDVEAALQYLLRRPDVDVDRIAVFGQSLGGSFAITAVAQSAHRRHVRALIVESAFAGYRQIFREKLASFWLTWPLHWPLGFTVRDEFSPIRYIESIGPIPLLIVHGERDPIVPAHHGRQLFEAARDPKELWILPQGRHIQAFRLPEYRDRLVEFLNRALAPRGK